MVSAAGQRVSVWALHLLSLALWVFLQILWFPPTDPDDVTSLRFHERWNGKIKIRRRKSEVKVNILNNRPVFLHIENISFEGGNCRDMGFTAEQWQIFNI